MSANMILPDPISIKPAFDIYKLLKENGADKVAKDRLKRMFDFLRSGETQIGIFGAGGTGKSTLGKLIITGDPFTLSEKYDPNWAIRHHKLPGKLSASFIIVPGQADYVSDEWPKAFTRLSKARSILIINVVSYGYHAFKFETFSKIPGYVEGTAKETFLNQYFYQRRMEEISRLKSLIEGIKEISIPVRLLTVATKQDLWWSQRQAVREFYSGEYSSILTDTKSTFKNAGVDFQFHFVPLCQVHANLRSENGDVIAETSKGYDWAHHLYSVQEVIGRVDELLLTATKNN